MPKNGDTSFFLCRTWNRQVGGRDQVFSKNGEEHKDVLQGESDRSQPFDQSTGDIEARDDFWSFVGSYTCGYHVEQMVNIFEPIKGHSQFHSHLLMMSGGRIRHWICFWKVVSTTTGTLMMARDYGIVDQFHTVYNAEKRTPNCYTWSGRRLTQIQVTLRPFCKLPDVWICLSKKF